MHLYKLLLLFIACECAEPKEFNVALRTELEFNKKSDISVIDTLQKYLENIKKVLEQRFLEDMTEFIDKYTFTDFINETLCIMESLTDPDLTAMLNVFKDEVNKYTENTVLRQLIGNINVKQLRKNIKSVLKTLRTEQRHPVLHFFNTLYKKDSERKLKHFVARLGAFKQKENLDLERIIRNGIKSVFINHFKSLNKSKKKIIKNLINDISMYTNKEYETHKSEEYYNNILLRNKNLKRIHKISKVQQPIAESESGNKYIHDRENKKEFGTEHNAILSVEAPEKMPDVRKHQDNSNTSTTKKKKYRTQNRKHKKRNYKKILTHSTERKSEIQEIKKELEPNYNKNKIRKAEMINLYKAIVRKALKNFKKKEHPRYKLKKYKNKNVGTNYRSNKKDGNKYNANEEISRTYSKIDNNVYKNLSLTISSEANRRDREKLESKILKNDNNTYKTIKSRFISLEKNDMDNDVETNESSGTKGKNKIHNTNSNSRTQSTIQRKVHRNTYTTMGNARRYKMDNSSEITKHNNVKAILPKAINNYNINENQLNGKAKENFTREYNLVNQNNLTTNPDTDTTKVFKVSYLTTPTSTIKDNINKTEENVTHNNEKNETKVQMQVTEIPPTTTTLTTHFNATFDLNSIIKKSHDDNFEIEKNKEVEDKMKADIRKLFEPSTTKPTKTTEADSFQELEKAFNIS